MWVKVNFGGFDDSIAIVHLFDFLPTLYFTVIFYRATEQQTDVVWSPLDLIPHSTICLHVVHCPIEASRATEVVAIALHFSLRMFILQYQGRFTSYCDQKLVM